MVRQGENSPFAKQLIRHLSDSKISEIDINGLADKVIKSVRFNYEQQAEVCPLFGTGHDGGRFIFYKKEDKEYKVERDFEEARNSKNKEILINFLQDSSNKDHKREVRKNLKAIEAGDQAWSEVDQNSYASLDEFTDEFPDHPMAKEAELLKAKFYKKKQIIRPVPHIFSAPNTITDPRDGQIYKTVKLKDGKTWLAQNLNFDVGEGSWLYKDPKNVEKYGRLYTWEAALKACPIGWHIPTDEEWNTMIKNYGGHYHRSKNKGQKAYKALMERRKQWIRCSFRWLPPLRWFTLWAWWLGVLLE